MARRVTKKRSTKKKTATRKSAGRAGRASSSRPSFNLAEVDGKHLVIVESPTKAKTINKYLGPDYFVMASVGHVRDLPTRNPKGVKNPVPGVNLEKDFEPSYEVLPAKRKTVADLKRAARKAADVWFATDLDREGEAIAWHLAKSLQVPIGHARRVVFNAITKREIAHAFEHPRQIDESKVNAQQARRILDRIVGYQVSPLLWKKVAGGLSAGRVQSVAVRLVVEREREIEAFIPEEYWRITGFFATERNRLDDLTEQWRQYLARGEVSQKERNAWLSEHQCLKAELIEVDGKPFKPDNRDEAIAAVKRLGYILDNADERMDEKGKGPARFLCRYDGHITHDNRPDYRIQSIQTKRSTTRPPAPFITSSMQQAAANRLGYSLQRTMRVAQQLYEGVNLKGTRGLTGLITYMRTDSTHLAGEAIEMAREYISQTCGGKYLPDKPNFYTSSNKDAQEAHEAIRPTDVTITPTSVRKVLNDEQFKLYDLIWRRFVACQMSPAQWDSTVILIETIPAAGLFKATGRSLVFDGFYRIAGQPNTGDDVILPALSEQQPLDPMQIDPTQHFTSPPPRYTEASLQKKLEEEGIGRPSTYAPIIATIQSRKYVEQLSPRDRRLMATDLGKVVTDMLVDAFPTVMDVTYTREMEAELDKVEDERHDWRQMLHDFYHPFKEKLDQAHDTLQHAKTVTEPAPHDCPTCGAPTVYRFGKNGRFLSCSQYPACEYAAPIDREGNPVQPELSDIVCPECGGGMSKRNGRYGPFLGCLNYPKCSGIIKLDPKKGTVVLPKPPPLMTDIACPKCGQPLVLRTGKRGFWLACSTFPKCRGRLSWSAVEPEKQKQLEDDWAKHDKEHPQPDIKTVDGKVVDENYIPRISGEDGDDGAISFDSDTSSYDAA